MCSLPIVLVLAQGRPKKRAAHYPAPPPCLTSIGFQWPRARVGRLRADCATWPMS